jgi:5-methylcytosine-specific restriction endonuclease McrA
MNRWRIPELLEKEVKERDKFCIYCGILMINKMPARGPRKSVATWEHIINDASIITLENIARCCVACNSSKGTKNSQIGYSRVIVRSMVLRRKQFRKLLKWP